MQHKPVCVSGHHRTCRECDSVYCSLCAKVDGVDAGRYCESDGCEKDSLCLGCRVTEEHDDCWGCQHLLYPKLLGEKGVLAEENGRLAEENDELHKEIDRLDKENEQLYKEKEQLRKEIEELGEKERDTFSRLAEENSELNKKMAELRKEIEELRKKA